MMVDSKRREFLKKVSLLGGASCFPMGCAIGEHGANKDSQILDWVAYYDSIGIHRTESEGDRETVNWISSIAKTLNLSPQRLPYSYRKVDAYTASLKVSGITVEGMPLYDTGSVSPQSFTGTLGPPGSECDIAVLKVPPHYGLPGGNKLLRLRKEGRYRAIVAITDATEIGIKPGLTPLNANAYREPYGPAVIQVSAVYKELIKAAHNKEVATFNFNIQHRLGESSNLLVEVPGTYPELAPLVVMTPLTGWWHCASERGGGVGLWLDLLMRSAHRRPSRPILFVATTGHELGHYGLTELLHSRPEKFSNVHAWLHLGASFCGRNAYLQLQGSDPHLTSRSLARMHKLNIYPDRVSSPPDKLVGEIKEVAHLGGNYLSLSGFNPWFHHPQDRWAESVDTLKTLAMAKVYRQWFDLLLEKSS